MFYDFAVTVPANTPELIPKTQEMKLTAGVIQKVSILFPPGPHGMVKLKLMEGGHQFLPTNPDGYFASDDEVLNIDEFYGLESAPYTLKAIAYSPDTTYNHTLRVRIGILRPEDVEKQSGLMVALKKFLKMVGLGAMVFMLYQFWRSVRLARYKSDAPDWARHWVIQ